MLADLPLLLDEVATKFDGGSDVEFNERLELIGALIEIVAKMCDASVEYRRVGPVIALCVLFEDVAPLRRGKIGRDHLDPAGAGGLELGLKLEEAIFSTRTQDDVCLVTQGQFTRDFFAQAGRGPGDQDPAVF